jgi:ABC-2 type transport system ATP-binding protein
MRCDLAASLIHFPKVLYLDEPTIGLDVAVKARFRQFIRHMHERRGLTVLLTSHDLGDIEELCDRMLMIDRGRIVYDGPFREITRRFGYEQSLHLALREDVPDAESSAGRAIAGREARVARPGAASLTVTFDARQTSAGELIRDLATALPLGDIRLEEPTAEAIIRKLYEGTLSFDEDEERAATPGEARR